MPMTVAHRQSEQVRSQAPVHQGVAEDTGAAQTAIGE